MTFEESNFDATQFLNTDGMLDNKFSAAPNNIYASDLVSANSGIDFFQLFNKSNLIRKIITRYPMEGRHIGYVVKDAKGGVVNTNDDILLKSFYEASVYSRLYGTTYLVLEFESDNNKPITHKEKLINHKIKFEMLLKGDFYFDKEEKRYHKDKVLVWEGQKQYTKRIYNTEQEEQSESILIGMYHSYCDYMNVKDTAKHILNNISYLTLGHDGLGTQIQSEEGYQRITERLLVINRIRNVQGIISYDRATEEVKFISQTLTGIQEIINGFRSNFVSDTEYPEDILFEESPRNQTSSGTQNQLVQRYLWAKRCSTWVSNNWLEHYERIFKLWLGLEDDHVIEIPFKFEQTPLEQAELENAGAERVKKLVEAGVIAPEEARSGYKGDEYTLNIELDEAAFKKMQLSSKPEPDKPTEEHIIGGSKTSPPAPRSGVFA